MNYKSDGNNNVNECNYGENNIDGNFINCNENGYVNRKDNNNCYYNKNNEIINDHNFNMSYKNDCNNNFNECNYSEDINNDGNIINCDVNGYVNGEDDDFINVTQKSKAMKPKHKQKY